ncbi:hypothetical protein [Melghirimyces profundicolus]|uniref:hypothetical protein n=1 Tax=Melghirimyces profundicolus TaxID=1242148 RepID=UPI0011B24021|nr:hypothetical protein [Melghirimyces profundicolus]
MVYHLGSVILSIITQAEGETGTSVLPPSVISCLPKRLRTPLLPLAMKKSPAKGGKITTEKTAFLLLHPDLIPGTDGGETRNGDPGSSGYTKESRFPPGSD